MTSTPTVEGASSAASRAVSLRVLLLRSLALGGLAGAAHVAFVSRTFYLKGNFAWASRDLIWMSPVANALLFVALSLVLWGIGKAASGRIREGTLEGVLAAFAALAVLLLTGGLHLVAIFLFAIGVGVQHARMANGGSRLVKHVTVVGLLLLVSLVVGGMIERATRGSRARTIATSAAPAGAPNVIVIIWDTVRAMSVSLYGAPRRTTPELERLATRATTFDWAIAPSPWTLPSHCSMFTGLQPGEHSCRWDVPLRDAPATLAEELARRGWRTGAFVANHYYTTHETGLQRGFGHYEDFQVTGRQLLLSSTLMQTAPGRDFLRGGTIAERTRWIRRLAFRGDAKPFVDRKLAAEATDAFLDWQAREPTQPFFAFLNLFDAHDPYEPPAPWDTKFPDAPARVAKYEGGIAYMDHELGRLLKALEERGVLENTIVVITSDHGELFGEHGLNNHGHALYMPLLHVPLVIRAPAGLPNGVRVPAVVALRDLAATLLDLTGVGPVPAIEGSSFATPERLAPADSASITRLALAETEKSKLFWTRGPARFGAMHSLLDDRWHYIRDAQGTEELFAYRTDTAEAANRAASEPTVTARFRQQLNMVTRRLVQ